MKLYITDQGDYSVGIPDTIFEIDVPFEKTDTENLEWFRKEQLKIYHDFCEGRMGASYDFEMEAESLFNKLNNRK